MTKFHKECEFSMGLDGLTTAGRGTLDWTGNWEFPCLECESKIRKALCEPVYVPPPPGPYQVPQ